MEYNPDAPGQQNGYLFGMPFEAADADLVLIPVPWDVTVSYSDGTALGPQAILDESPQLDFFDEDYPELWKRGIHMESITKKWQKEGKSLRKLAKKYIKWLEKGQPSGDEDEMEHLLKLINKANEQMRQQIFRKASSYLLHGKLVAVLGGDHSSPLGLIDALSQRYSDFGILQIDAHMDLREAYEGFTLSHASIMYNALANIQVSKLVQVGIRDYCFEEAERVEKSEGRIQAFTSRYLAKQVAEGKTWKSLCNEIIKALPDKVYVSFDIDGLMPYLCPGTGTPVPGGLEFEPVCYLIRQLVKSGKQIIGFDLCETGNSAWDANVGARIVWQLSLATLASNPVKP